jgi:hypothetical protein
MNCVRVSNMRPAKLSLILLVLAGGVLLDPASAQSATTRITTTPAPEVTPVPAAGTLVRVSYLIDGVVYVMQCNFTGMNMSNCSFATDHGLTVTPLSGGTDLPDYTVALLWVTLAVVGILLAMAIYTVYALRNGGMMGYQPVPAPQPQQAQQPQYVEPQPAGPPQYAEPQYAQYVPPSAYQGQAGRAGGRPKIIGVNLVQPCLP